MNSLPVMRRLGVLRWIVSCVGLISLAGCATHGVKPLPDSDPRVANAMNYARSLLRTTEPVPVRWYTKRGTHKSGDGMWCYRSSWGGHWAGGQTQFLDGYTRVVVYTGPDGEQLDVVWPHEAVHAVGRGIIDYSKELHPEKTRTGIRLRGVVPYW